MQVQSVFTFLRNVSSDTWIDETFFHGGGQQYTSNRLRTLGELKEKRINPYPHKFDRSMSVPEYIKEFSSIEAGQHIESKAVSVAGMSKNLTTGGKSAIADDTSILRRKNHLMHDEKLCQC